MSPRRGRGVDFEQRFRTSRWAEDLLIAAFNKHELLAIRLGLSETSADNLIRDADTRYKVPDLLIFDPARLSPKEKESLEQTDFTRRTPDALAPGTAGGQTLRKALCAIEVEFSPYKAAEMKGRDWKRKSPDELARRPRKQAKPPVAPNIWIKDEDLAPLHRWQEMMGIPIVVCHLFDQEAFAVTLADVVGLSRKLSRRPAAAIAIQLSTGIFRKTQTYDRVDAQGAREHKDVFVVTPAAAVRAGIVRDVRVESQLGLSASKKYVAHVLFTGGRIEFDEEFVKLVRELRGSS